jgi:Mg2+/Co2+ transporter CorB
MSTYFFLSLLAIASLIVISAFFAGSETALTAVSRGVMHRLEKSGSRSALFVNRLVGDRERLIGTLLLGNTFVNILASCLATATLESALGRRSVALATAVMTVIILVFAEVLPKTLAIARTDRFALAVARPVLLVMTVLAPVAALVQYLVWRLLDLFGVTEEKQKPVLSANEEIRGTIFLHHQEGTVEREHRNMISGVLDLPNLAVADVMVHRRNMVALDGDAPLRDVIDELASANHTRIPLWREQPENIVGIVHTKDLVRALVESQGDIDALKLESLASPPWFVPETTSLEEQLAAFRRKRSHFALVVDEYGALQGLVTLNDILDEIFGDIPDEHEVLESPGIRKLSDGGYAIDGIHSIRDVNRALDWNLPDDIATTIAGLVINEAQMIPEVGQRFAFFGFEFEILRRQRNQITSIRVTPQKGLSVPATPRPA